MIKKGGPVLLAKNFDWPAGEGCIFVNKRNVVKSAFRGGDSPLSWISKYGSVTFNQFGREFPLGGINEAGLIIEALNVQSGDLLPDHRPSVNEFQWIQYQLDNSASVKDVLKSDAKIRISKFLAALHYLVADRKGKAAIIEFSGGKMVPYTGKSLIVPVLIDRCYADSLRNLSHYEGYGGDKKPSWESGSADRFVRIAAYLDELVYLGQSPMVDEAFTMLRSVEQGSTQWSIVYSIPWRRIFFKTRSHRVFKVVRLDALDFSCASPVLMVPVDTDEAGVLTKMFAPYDPAKNRLLLDSVFRKLADLGIPGHPVPEKTVEELAGYPESLRCR